MIDKETAKRLADAIGEGSSERRTDAYGTVASSGGGVRVRLDGSEIETPSDTTVTVNKGDRVMVRVDDHRLVVTGNVTNEAVDKRLFHTTIEPIEEKTNCIVITDDGIDVGDVRNGRWVGTRVRMGNHAFSILDENGAELASFDKDDVSFGQVKFGKVVNDWNPDYYNGLVYTDGGGTLRLMNAGSADASFIDIDDSIVKISSPTTRVESLEVGGTLSVTGSLYVNGVKIEAKGAGE